MKSVFVAFFLIFDAQSGALVDIASGLSFENPDQCHAFVAQAIEKAAGDMTVAVQGGCVETVVVPAE